VAIELAPRLGEKVNLERVLMMLAIHDLCEIELKDTIVFRGKKPTPDEEKEALYKLVQSSPQRELYLELFREFQKAQELQEDPKLAEEFKRASELPPDQRPKDIPTIDAVFAVSVDVLSACFVLLSTSKTKAVELWKTYNYSRTRFEKERFKPVCDWNPFLKEYYRYLFAKIDEKIGWSCG
jgi:hypothetical protein